MFENITYETLLSRMLERVSGSLDRREGSVIWDTHSSAAIELQNLYIALDSVIQEAYGDTATREFLILRCKERGIVPFPATKAVLRGEFSPAGIDCTGRRFNIGAMNYQVIERITDGIYRVQCETQGEEGNRYLGTMTPIEYISGLESAQLTQVLIPGEDEEDTEALRQRYFASFEERAFGGNRKDYLDRVNAINGVGGTKVTRVWNGDLSPVAMLPTAAVKTWYESVSPGLEGEVKNWLTTVYSAAEQKKLTTGGTVLLTVLDSEFHRASEELLQTVQRTMDPEENAGEGYGLAPIGHVVSVKSVTEVPVAVRIQLQFETGYGWEELRQPIEAVTAEYLAQLRREWAGAEQLVVRVSQIETRILSVRGVVDAGETTLNGIVGNLILDPYEVPVPGGVER